MDAEGVGVGVGVVEVEACLNACTVGTALPSFTL